MADTYWVYMQSRANPKHIYIYADGPFISGLQIASDPPVLFEPMPHELDEPDRAVQQPGHHGNGQRGRGPI